MQRGLGNAEHGHEPFHGDVQAAAQVIQLLHRKPDLERLDEFGRGELKRRTPACRAMRQVSHDAAARFPGADTAVIHSGCFLNEVEFFFHLILIYVSFAT